MSDGAGAPQLTKDGARFSVHAPDASALWLCLFDAQDGEARLPMERGANGVWQVAARGVGAGARYGLRADGPYDPPAGLWFDPDKLLLDPYARKLSGSLRWNDVLHGYPIRGRRGDLGFDKRDSAPAMPKGVVTHDSFDWSRDVRPNIPWSQTVIYEAHAKGLTKLLEAAPPQERDGDVKRVQGGPSHRPE